MSQKKSRPLKADFAIVIEFVRDEANPQQIFQAADALIKALHEFDRMLIKSIGIEPIEPILILEDIEWSPDDDERGAARQEREGEVA